VTRMVAVDREAPSRGALDLAAAILSSGGLVAFPTESFYGLGADALDPRALARVFAVKGRPESKPLLVLVDSVAMVEGLVSEVPAGARELMARHWPGALTLVLKAAAHVPRKLTAGTGTVGVRMPGHPVALALVRAARLAVTAPSANPSGAADDRTGRAAPLRGRGGPDPRRRVDRGRRGLHHRRLHGLASSRPAPGAGGNMRGLA
jgi:L-threonylcarbamoyladenylate synthase